MDMFERHKNDSIYTNYLENSRDKIINGSSKFINEIGKIHIPISGKTGMDLHNFLHESIHFMLSESPLFRQIRDLMLTLDFISSFTQDLNFLPYSAKQDQIEFAMDLLSGNKSFNCKRYKELCLVYFTCGRLYRRSKLLLKNSVMCNEGAATYCALHIQEYSKNSILEFLFKTFIPKKNVNELYSAQKKIIEKISNLPDDNLYATGYRYAEQIANHYGIESVIMIAMLANYVPFYSFDLLHDEEVFEERLKYLYNADERLKYFFSFNSNKQKKILGYIEEQKKMKTVFKMLDKQKRPERKFDFLDIDMYYKYYLVLHKKIIDTISYIVDEDMENEIVNFVRNRVFPSVTPIDTYYFGLCKPQKQLELLKKNEAYIKFAENAINTIVNFNTKPQKYITQITERDVKIMIDRTSLYETYYLVMQKLENIGYTKEE